MAESKRKKIAATLKKSVVSIQRDHARTAANAQCCKPGPCSPKWGSHRFGYHQTRRGTRMSPLSTSIKKEVYGIRKEYMGDENKSIRRNWIVAC